MEMQYRHFYAVLFNAIPHGDQQFALSQEQGLGDHVIGERMLRKEQEIQILLDRNNFSAWKYFGLWTCSCLTIITNRDLLFASIKGKCEKVY